MTSRVPLYRNRYRVPSSRLAGWDYRKPGYYFVTICTEGRDPCFGSVGGGRVLASPYGEIAAREWLRLPARFPRVTLDAWIVMPDHLHGILILGPVSEGSPTASLGDIVGQFKSKSTRSIRARGHSVFAWQERFHERILGDAKDLKAVRAYILENPIRWEAKIHTSPP